MPIITKFNTGEHAYLAEKAALGILSKVKIITVESKDVSGSRTTRYQIYGTSVYNKTWYPEEQLLTFLEAKEISLAALNRSIQELTARDAEIRGDFQPIGSRLSIIY